MARRATSVSKAMESNSCGAPGCRWNSTGTPAAAEFGRVGGVLVAEQVELADLDVGRGKVSCILEPCGRSRGGDVGPSDGVAEIRLPPRDKVTGVVDEGREVGVRGAGAVVEHRHDEDLAGDLRPTSLSREDRHGCGHAASRRCRP